MSAVAPKPLEIVGLDLEVIEFTKSYDLSAREVEIFRLLLSGAVTAEQIAQNLNISPHTVNNHLKSIFEKTGTPNKTELVASFVRRLLRRLNHLKYFIKRPKILVVDDEPDICEAVSGFLTDRGLESVATADPMVALQLVKERVLDFVISDIDMPKLSGHELLKGIRRMHREVPMMIFITGKPQYDLQTSLDQGAVAFLEKPVMPDHLYFTIMEHFVEGDHERSRLVRVETAIPATVNHAYKFTIAEIGFGGVFVPFGSHTVTAERRFKVGSMIDFSFQLGGEGPQLQARGEVVWRRDRAELGLQAGMGVKFMELSPSTRYEIENYVRLHKIISCVPLGRF